MRVDVVATCIDKVNEMKIDAVCIGSLPPTGLVQIRYLCKRLRQRNKNVRILIGRWGDTAHPEAFAEIAEVGATAIEVSIEKSLSLLATWRPLLVDDREAENRAPTVMPIGTSSAPTPVVAT